MNLWDNKRLNDIAARSQILIEGVKAGENIRLNTIIREMFEDLGAILSRPQYTDLSLLSKKALNELLKALSDVQGRAYTRYVSSAMEGLRDFCDAQAIVQRRVWSYVRFNIDNEPEEPPALFSDEKSNAFMLAFVPGFKQLFTAKYATDNDRLWQGVTNNPVPGTGLYALPTYQGVMTAAGVRVANEVRKAWTTPGSSGNALATALLEVPKQGGASALVTTLRNSASAVATVTQHAAQFIAQAVASVLFGRYRWDSIIDSRTSHICRERNKQTWIMGQGPVPPAHPHCRSHISPIVNSSSARAESLYTWLRSQPRELLEYLFGSKGAEALIDGTMTPGDLPAIAFEPLSYNDYLARVNTVIN